MPTRPLRPYSPHPDAPIRTAAVLTALSLATDLADGQPIGHVARTCFVGMELAERIALPHTERATLYYATLLVHSGCTASSATIADVVGGDDLTARRELALLPAADYPAGMDVITEAYVSTCEVASRVAWRIGMPTSVQRALRYRLECWDGNGPHGLTGEDIPVVARILHLTTQFDKAVSAWGPHGAARFVREHTGRVFDPRLADALLHLADRATFWEELADAAIPERITEREPDSPQRWMDGEQLDAVLLAFADFTDLKSTYTLGHSSATATIAHAIAARLSLPDEAVALIRAAALTHDLGLAAIPNPLLDTAGGHTMAEFERFRLHPYYTERILMRVPGFATVARVAAMHHEAVNGMGYHLGLSGSQIPMVARVVALAAAFESACRPLPHTPLRTPEAACASLGAVVGSQFDPECYAALAASVGVLIERRRDRRERPAGLTEREIEVLRLLATGHTNKQTAQTLSLSEKTVGRHIENIYGKIAVSSRAAAAMFAMEHELL